MDPRLEAILEKSVEVCKAEYRELEICAKKHGAKDGQGVAPPGCEELFVKLGSCVEDLLRKEGISRADVMKN